MSGLVLTLLDEHDLHVKDYRGGEGFKRLPTDTHYIMRGGNVVASLNRSEIDRWVINKSIQIKSVKSLLDSEGLDYRSADLCERFLSDTVMSRKNIEIYRLFIC